MPKNLLHQHSSTHHSDKSLTNEISTQELMRHIAMIHHQAKVTRDHFPKFKEALMITLEQELGRKWTPEMAEAWGCVFDRVASLAL